MCVGSYKRDMIFGKVKINAIHDRTKFVVSCAENGFVYSIEEHLRLHGDVMTSLLCLGHLRIFVAVDTYERIRTIYGIDNHTERVVVDSESKGLSGELLHGVNKKFCAESHFSFAFCILYINSGANGRFAIRCSQRKGVS